MSLSSRGSVRARAAAAMDAVQSLGLVVLLVGLGASEAAKSIGIGLAVLGFVGKSVLAGPPRLRATAPLVALGAFFLASVLSVAVAAPGFGLPRELLTLAITVVAFPLTLDACSRRSRRILLGGAIITGALVAALWGYGAHMTGHYLRLGLPSVENAVPAGEYLGAACAFGLAVLLAERRSPVVGPLAAFALGASCIALVMTLSRGPLLGTVVGVVVAVAVGLRRRRAALAIVLGLALAVTVFGLANPGARLVKEGILGSRTASARFHTWQTTLDLVGSRPLTGHGPGSYPLLGVAYYDDVWGAEHQLNAHNVLLNAAAETGVIGCGTLLLFLVLGIRSVVRSIRSASWPLERAVLVGALAGTAAILASGVFSVSTDAEPGILLFTLLGLGAGGAREPSVENGGTT